MSSDIHQTVNRLLDKWQERLSIADTPALALLVIQEHPLVSASLAEHLVRSIIIDRALAARRLLES
jgi:hypothetical protein